MFSVLWNALQRPLFRSELPNFFGLLPLKIKQSLAETTCHMLRCQPVKLLIIVMTQWLIILCIK